MSASIVENITFVAPASRAGEAALYLKESLMTSLASPRTQHMRLARVQAQGDETASFALEAGFASPLEAKYWLKHSLQPALDKAAADWGDALLHFRTRLEIIK